MGHIRRIHTTNAAKLQGKEFNLLTKLLSECFELWELENTMTWKSLHSGEAKWNGRGNYNDNKMIHMVNTYPDALKRAKMQHLFGLLDKGEYLDFSGFQLPFATLIPRANARYNSARLSQITNVRMEKVRRYLREIQQTSLYSHPTLSQNNNFFQLTKGLEWGNNWQDCFFSVDIENFEGHEDRITEIGISVMDPTLATGEPAGTPSVLLINMHIIIQENQHLRNGRYVEDNRDYFTGGKSMIMNRAQALKFLQTVVDFYFVERKSWGMDCLIVGQSVGGDLRKLENLGIKFPGGTRQVDTLGLSALSLGRGNSSLKSLLYGIGCSSFAEVDYLHNAGNDARATLALFMAMMRIETREELFLDHVHSRVYYDHRVERELRTHVKRQVQPQRRVRHYRWDEAIVAVFKSHYD